MALISGTISNLFSGVSQQAPALRLPTQAEEMDNFYPSLVDGLVKRPPIKDLFEFGTVAQGEAAKLHVINRDADNRYIACLHREMVTVFRMDGSYVTGRSNDYLKGIDPNTAQFLTVADHTFIVNTKKTVEYVLDSNSEAVGGALISVKQASYDTTYEIQVLVLGNDSQWKPFVTVVSTPMNFSTGDTPPPSISTKEIAWDLYNKLKTNSNFTAQMDIQILDSTIYIKPLNDSTIYRCKVSDSRGNTLIYLAKDSVQKFSDLPSIAVRDFTIKVTGDENSAFDNYYVKFVPNETGMFFGSGAWVETRDPKMGHKVLAPLTMPNALVHQPDGSFRFGPVDWEPRSAGDGDSAPDPLFLGAKISEMFLYRNRLGILSDDNLTLSAASDFFRFYPETVTTIVDSDPISLSAGHETVTMLKHAIPFQENLVVFSENAQFNMPTADTLSPATAALKISTTFEANLTVKPVTTGQTVAFCVRNGAYTGLREFYMDSDTLTRMTGNLTAHVPTFVPGDPLVMACSTTEDLIILVSKKERNKMYVYKYYWSGNEKLQSAWFTYSLPKNHNIVSAVFFESTLYLLINRNGTMWLSMMDCAPEHLTDDTDLSTTTLYLDRQLDLPKGAYDSEKNSTSWSLGGSARRRQLSAGEISCLVDRRTLKQIPCTVATDGLQLTAEGDCSGKSYVFGVLYPSTYTFSEQFLRSDDGSGNRIATQLGRLQFRRWALIYGPSCFFKVRTEQNGTVYEYPFTGEFVNHPRSFLAKPALYKGKFSFPVKSVSDRVKVTITNDTCLPCSIIGAEWEAFYTQRQRGRI